MIRIRILVSMITLFVLIKESIEAACNEGCLRCVSLAEGGSECRVCDPMRGFVLKNGECQASVVENCLLSYGSNRCNICRYGYYLTTEFKCAAVPRRTKISIQSCNNYLTIEECLACDFYTYQRNGQCRPIMKQITDCTIYRNPTQCEVCNMKLPSFDRRQCEDVPPARYEHCLFFRHPLKCTKCKPGYELDENLFVKRIEEEQFYQPFFTKLKFWREQYFDLMMDTPVCTWQYSIDNCKVLGYNNTCVQCNDGYTLTPDRKQCFMKPTPPVDPKSRIPNCNRFGSQNYEVCSICYENFYLTDLNTRCRKHTRVVPNCSIHSQTTDSKCVYCDNAYYLDLAETNNTLVCKLRSNFFNNCENYDRATDSCSKCKDGHLFHYNNRRCSLAIPKCVVHDPTDRILKCSNCIDSHYLNDFNTVCIDAKASTEGCKKYNYNAVCLECLQGYYLDVTTKKCLTQDRYDKCEIRSVTVKGECTTCEKQGTRSVQTDTCINLGQINLVADCLTYNKNQVCTSCKTNKVPFLKDNKVTCIDFTNCASLLTITDETKCGECLTGALLWDGKCLKADTSNCVNVFDKNSTFSTSWFIDEIPCEVCGEGTYYVAGSQTLEARCISIKLGDNCLNYYSSTADISKDAVCIQCRRGYRLGPSKQGCIPDDVYPPFSSASLTLMNQAVRSNNATASYSNNDATVVAATIFPGRTFNSTTWVGSVCEQLNANKNKCLACKNFTCAVYTATSFANLFNVANQFSRVAYIYRTNLTKLTYEQNFTDYAAPVSDCRFCSSFESGMYPKEAKTFIINGVTHYLCRWTPDLSMWTKDDELMSLNVTITSTNLPTGYVWNDATSYTSSCQFIPASLTLPPNCKSNFNDTDLALTFNQRALISSCQVCITGHVLSFGIYSASVFYSAITKTFKWIINECTPITSLASYYQISNCFYYEKTYLNEQNNYFCKDCGPGSYPVFSEKPVVCLKNDTYYTLSKMDHCSGTRYCDDRKRCREVCNPACASDSFCSLDGACFKKVCPYCSSNQNDPKCVDTVDGCPFDQYCEKNVCKNKCTCKFQEKCDSSTNYKCVPYGCGEFQQTDVYTLYANVTARKAEKVQQLLAQQESNWLNGNKTTASSALSAAIADFTTYNTSLKTTVETDKNFACTYRDQIIQNDHENATEASQSEANCATAVSKYNDYLAIESQIEGALTATNQARDTCNAATTSDAAKICADAAVLNRGYVAGNLTAAQALSVLITTEKTKNFNIYTNLVSNVQAATAALTEALACKTQAEALHTSALGAQTTAITAYDNKNSADFLTQLNNVASQKATAATLKTNAAAFAVTADSHLPGSSIASDAASNSAAVATFSTQINDIHTELTNIYFIFDIYNWSVLAEQAKNDVVALEPDADTAFANNDSTAVSGYLTTATNKGNTVAGYLTSADTQVTSVKNFFGESSSYYTAAQGYYDLIVGYQTTITQTKNKLIEMNASLAIRVELLKLEKIQTDFHDLYVTAQTYYSADEASYLATKTNSAYTALSGAQTLANTVSSMATTAIANYDLYDTQNQDYKTRAQTAIDTINAEKKMHGFIGDAFYMIILDSYTTGNYTILQDHHTYFMSLSDPDKRKYLKEDNFTDVGALVQKIKTFSESAQPIYDNSTTGSDTTKNFMVDIGNYNTAIQSKYTSAIDLESQFVAPQDEVGARLRALPIRSDAEFRMVQKLTLEERLQKMRGMLRERKLRMVSRMLYTQEDFEIQVDNMWWGPGCDQTFFCHEMTCFNNTGCPVCPKDKMCSRVARTGGFNYACVSDTQCNTKCKNDNLYCHSKIVNNVLEFDNCYSYPQRVLSASTCTPACQSTEVCIDGVCNKAFADACSWAFNNTVPVYCGTDETCENEVCIKNCQPKCEEGYWCDRAINSCIPVISPPVREAYISQCIKIDGCAIDHTSRVINDCLRCNATSAFQVTYNNGQIFSINNRSCIASVNNCKYAYPDAVFGSICAECDKGYVLQNGLCSTSSVPNCIHFDILGNCRWCTDNYFNEAKMVMNGTFEKGGCMTYPQLNNLTANPDTDMNCGYFKYFYLSSDLTPPVAISKGKSVCSKCRDAYFLTNSFKCYLKSVADCIDYDKTVTSQSAVVCTQCDVGYSLSADKKQCTDNTPTQQKFLIPQCKRYNINKSCVMCNDGYMLRNVGTNVYGQTSYCFEQKHNDGNCAEVDANSFTSTGFMTCKSCNKISGAFAYPNVLGTGIKTCMPIAQRANCAIQNSGAFTLDYVCTLCNNNLYYLDSDLICQKRTNLIPNCEQYKINDDVCEKITTTTTVVVVSSDSLPVDVQRLIANPPVKLDSDMIVDFNGWIMGCKVYLDSATCYSCYPPKYLNPLGVEYNTKCKSVNRPIDHCAWYDKDGEICLACDQFYLLADNQCLLKTAQNCLEYQDADNCKSCPSKYPIIDEDGNCGIDPTNPWCLEYDNSIPGLLSYECDVCMENYYPNDSGICTLVTNPIDACKYYWSDRVCKQCEEGFYLRSDGKFCDINPSFDENCVEFSYGTECSVCEFGYYLYKGVCTACPPSEGCAYCSSTNTTQCLMCKFGYEMNKNGECTAKDGNENQEYVRTYFFYSKTAPNVSDTAGNSLIGQSATILAKSILGMISAFTYLFYL